VAGIRRETNGDLAVLSVAEHDLAFMCRLMPASAAYDSTRVAVATDVVHTGIRHNYRAARDGSVPCLSDSRKYV